MVTWRYEVVVKSSVEKDMQNAINSLHAAQETAATHFSNMMAFLEGDDDFASKILNQLATELELFEIKKIEVEFDTKFNPMVKGINEIRMGVYTLLDLKHGSVFDVVDALKQTQKDLGIDSINLPEKNVKDLFEDQFKNLGLTVEKRQEGMDEELLKIYRSNPLTLQKDRKVKFLDMSEENIYRPKFTKHSIDDLTEISKDPKKAIRDVFVKEIQDVLKKHTPDKFAKLYGTKNTDAMDKRFKETLTEIYNLRIELRDVPKTKIGKKNPYLATIRKGLRDEITAKAEDLIGSGDWVNFKTAIINTLKKAIEISSSEFLKGSEIQKLLKPDLLKNIIEETKNSLISKATKNVSGYDKLSPGKEPNIYQVIVGIMKQKNLFDKDVMNKNINVGKVPNLTKDVQTIINKVHKEMEKNNTSMKYFEAELKKNLLTKYPLLVEPIMGLISKETKIIETRLLKEFRNLLKDKKLSTKEIRKYMEEFKNIFPEVNRRALGLQSPKDEDKEKKKLGKKLDTKSSDEIDIFDMQDWYEKAKTNNNEYFGSIIAGMTQMFEVITKLEERMDEGLNQISTDIRSIDIQEQDHIAAHGSDTVKTGSTGRKYGAHGKFV